MDALALIAFISEATEVLVGLMKVGIVMERDFCFFNGAHEALGVAVLRGLADGCHADLDAVRVQRVDRRRRGVLPPLVGVMELGPMLRQRPTPGDQGQGLVQVAAQMPTAHAAGLDLHEDSQVHERITSTDRGHVADPYLIRAYHRQALHEVRVARGGMVAGHDPRATPWALSLPPHVAQEPVDG